MRILEVRVKRNSSTNVPPGHRGRTAFLRVLPLVLLALILAGCSSSGDVAALATPTDAPAPSATNTPLPSATPTVTPVPVLPVLGGTPFPRPQEVISPANLERIGPLSFLSTGWGPQDVALSGDHRTLAIASAAGVHLYDAGTLQELPFLPTNSAHSQVTCAAISFDGSLLATADLSGTIEIWDLADRRLLQTLLYGHVERINSLAFSPDSALLASGGDDARLVLWNVGTGNKLRTASLGGRIYKVAFSPDGGAVFSGTHAATVVMQDVLSGQTLNTFWDTRPVRAIAISPDGRLLASGSDASTITVWDISNNGKRYTLNGEFQSVFSLAFSLDGSRLASASADVVKLWDVESGEEIRASEHRACANTVFFGDRATANLVVFLPDDRTLLSGCPDEGKIRLWNVQGVGILREWPFGNNTVTSIAFSPDGERVAAGFYENIITKVWDAADGGLLHTLSEDYQGTNCDSVNSLAFEPGGSRLAAASSCNYRMVRLWDLERGVRLQALDTTDGSALTFTADGRWLAWAALDKIVLWDPIDRRVVLRWKAAQDGQGIRSLAFSPDGRFLAAAISSANKFAGQIQLWDPQGGRLVRVMAEHLYDVGALAFSPDGLLLAAVTGVDQIRIWKVENGQLVRTLSDGDDQMMSLAFSPSGELLVSGGRSYQDHDPAIRFWNVEDGRLLQTLPAPQMRRINLTFSPDGRLLLLGGFDGTVRLWGVLP